MNRAYHRAFMPHPDAISFHLLAVRLAFKEALVGSLAFVLCISLALLLLWLGGSEQRRVRLLLFVGSCFARVRMLAALVFVFVCVYAVRQPILERQLYPCPARTTLSDCSPIVTTIFGGFDGRTCDGSCKAAIADRFAHADEKEFILNTYSLPGCTANRTGCAYKGRRRRTHNWRHTRHAMIRAERSARLARAEQSARMAAAQ